MYKRQVEELRRRLSGENRPEVALCANNHIALECLQCAMQLGLRIPRDLALMTFDRYPFSQLLIPRLTAVEVDMFDMGWEAARFLVQKIKKPGLQVQTFCTCLLYTSTTFAYYDTGLTCGLMEVALASLGYQTHYFGTINGEYAPMDLADGKYQSMRCV